MERFVVRPTKIERISPTSLMAFHYSKPWDRSNDANLVMNLTFMSIHATFIRRQISFLVPNTSVGCQPHGALPKSQLPSGVVTRKACPHSAKSKAGGLTDEGRAGGGVESFSATAVSSAPLPTALSSLQGEAKEH